MNTRIQKIKEYFSKRQNIILTLLCFGVILAIIRDVPFFNLIFPENTSLFLIFVLTVALFRWYRNYIFFLILIIPTVILNFMGSVMHSEQVTILIFVILLMLIIDQTFAFLKNEA